ncbi:MAG: response regulator [Anaerolineales bacterium]|nr:response regulator [Anaerolineales bacterium]
MKVLIADDAEFSRNRISETLSGAGFAVLEADNGIDAVRAYEMEWPEVVLMDTSMPEMDGLSALRAIKDLNPEACVVMLTRVGQEIMLLDALEAGADGYLVKPISPDLMLAAIHRVSL